MNRRNVLAAGLALPGLMAARERTRATGTPSAVDEWAQPEWFVDPEWIFDHLADDSVQIIALTPDQDFLDGHLPGAVQIDWPDLALTDSADATVDAWRTDVERRLTDLGVSASSTVVIYDGGTFYAPRLWWILDQLGHADKRILDGGLPAWREARIETETGQAEIQLALEPYVGTPNEDALARIDEVAMVSEKGGGVLVDARTPEEFERGRIPNAVNVPFLENSENGSGGKWKSPSQLRGMYEDEGATPEKRVIAYCSTGVRSAATYFTLKALGYEQVKLYSASFEEWSSDPTRPIETRVGS